MSLALPFDLFMFSIGVDGSWRLNWGGGKNEKGKGSHDTRNHLSQGQ